MAHGLLGIAHDHDMGIHVGISCTDRLHMPVQEVTFDPEFVFWLSAGIPSDIDTCRIIQQSCVGNNTQYGSVADCLSYMQKLPSQSCAESSFQGECKQCKWLHHVMATYKPDVHCIHVGPVGGPDIYGDYLCNTTACVEPYEQLGVLY